MGGAGVGGAGRLDQRPTLFFLEGRKIERRPFGSVPDEPTQQPVLMLCGAPWR
jgi:hypothetical protein